MNLLLRRTPCPNDRIHSPSPTSLFSRLRRPCGHRLLGEACLSFVELLTSVSLAEQGKLTIGPVFPLINNLFLCFWLKFNKKNFSETKTCEKQVRKDQHLLCTKLILPSLPSHVPYSSGWVGHRRKPRLAPDRRASFLSESKSWRNLKLDLGTSTSTAHLLKPESFFQQLQRYTFHSGRGRRVS